MGKRKTDQSTKIPKKISMNRTEEELEPYVRRKKAKGNNRKKMQGLNEQEQDLLRNLINSNERGRMHRLNEEYEVLRKCLPYFNDANSQHRSKADTLMLASNRIQQLHNVIHWLQTELNAAKLQIATLLNSTQENRPTFAQPAPAQSNSKCSKCQQNSCFSVSCITAV